MKSSLPSTIVRALPEVKALPGFAPDRKIRPKFSVEELKDTGFALTLGPRRCWSVLKYDHKSFADVFEHYVFWLAAIPAVSGFVGHGLLGHTNLTLAFTRAMAGYLLSVAFFYLAVLIARKSAPMFDGEISFDRAAKLVIYSLIPFFSCGAILLVPQLSALALAGSISFFYFLYGVREMSNIPLKKQLTYGMVNVVVWIVFADTSMQLLFR